LQTRYSSLTVEELFEYVLPRVESQLTRPCDVKLYLRGPAFIVRVDEEFAAAGGVIPILPGVGEVWSILDDLARRYPLSLHRHAKRFIQSCIASNIWHRLQAHVREDNLIARKWIQYLGFHKEATLPLMGPLGETYILYSLFPGWGKE